jgi:hypothetical protein
VKNFDRLLDPVQFFPPRTFFVSRDLAWVDVYDIDIDSIDMPAKKVGSLGEFEHLVLLAA